MSVYIPTFIPGFQRLGRDLKASTLTQVPIHVAERSALSCGIKPNPFILQGQLPPNTILIRSSITVQMPSSSRNFPPGEGIRRKASRSDPDQEVFGQNPGIPTPLNVSPLYSGSSSETSLHPHASLLSPSVDIGAHSRSQFSFYESPITTTSAVPTIPLPVQSGFPPQTKRESLPADTTHHHQAQSECIRPASGGKWARFWGKLLKLRVPFKPFRVLLCIPIRRAAERPGRNTSVSLEIPPFRVDLMGHTEQTSK